MFGTDATTQESTQNATVANPRRTRVDAAGRPIARPATPPRAESGEN